MEALSGTVFTIIRGSFVDGWGIRSTIFLKGCPLRCRWCCNPESQIMTPQLGITADDCTNCGLCEGICHALRLKNAGPEVDREVCTDCGLCADSCPTNALSMFGTRYSVEEAFDTLVRDKAYYERSGGGVTIGGGEATMQAEFCYALLKRLQSEHIHVAIDTCGYTVSALSLTILEEADLLLFDLKGFDPDRHMEDTGVDNAKIHENLLHLGTLNKDIIIRLPLIPGHTDGDETLLREVELIRRVGSVRRIDLLPYHDYGRIKYAQLGRSYPMEGLAAQSAERMEAIRMLVASSGIPTQIGG